VIFIYRAIESGMVSLVDVNAGRVTLADLVEVNHYLDMKGDIEFMAHEKAAKEAKRKGGR
jgi:hypothetical protein